LCGHHQIKSRSLKKVFANLIPQSRLHLDKTSSRTRTIAIRRLQFGISA
jgi:hypothetical protein